MSSRPSSYLNWTDGSPTKVVQPPSAFSLAGWLAGQAPPFQYMNYLFYLTDQWIQWLDQLTFGAGGYNDTPVGTCNGVNDTFVLNKTPSAATTIIPFVDDVPLAQSEFSYNSGSNSIILNVPPATGQSVEAYYTIGGIGGGGGGGGGASGYVVTRGTVTSPQVITTAGISGISMDPLQQQYIVSSGGAVTVTNNPQIGVGTQIGQKLILKGTSDTNYITLNDGNGLSMNGPCNVTSKQSIQFDWNGTVWSEDFRTF